MSEEVGKSYGLTLPSLSETRKAMQPDVLAVGVEGGGEDPFFHTVLTVRNRSQRGNSTRCVSCGCGRPRQKKNKKQKNKNKQTNKQTNKQKKKKPKNKNNVSHNILTDVDCCQRGNTVRCFLAVSVQGGPKISFSHRSFLERERNPMCWLSVLKTEANSYFSHHPHWLGLLPESDCSPICWLWMSEAMVKIYVFTLSSLTDIDRSGLSICFSCSVERNMGVI